MFKQRVQGFAVGAATVAAIMVGLPMLSASSPNPELDEFAASLGVDIVWTSLNPCKLHRSDNIGCFVVATPNTIYVEPSIKNPGMDTFAVLHELGHVMQNRRGLPLDEKGADRMAWALRTQQ